MNQMNEHTETTKSTAKKRLHWGITAFAVIFFSIASYLILSRSTTPWTILALILGALRPIIYGCVIAYFLNRPMSFFVKHLRRLSEKRKSRDIVKSNAQHTPKFAMLKRKPRPDKTDTHIKVASLLFTTVIVIGVVSGIVIMILPELYTTISTLYRRLPGYYKNTEDWINNLFASNPAIEDTITNLFGNISQSLSGWLQTTVLPQLKSMVSNVGSGTIGVLMAFMNIIIGLVISFTLLLNKEKFRRHALLIIYSILKVEHANKVLEKARLLNDNCGHFIAGQILDSLILGAVCAIAFSILGIPYALLAATVVCVTNVIPFFGPYIGGIPCALLILMVSPGKCLLFAIVIVVLQQIDGSFLNPKIQSGQIGLNSFWVIFATMLFGGLFGLWGYIFGAPVFTIIYGIIKEVVDLRLDKKRFQHELDKVDDEYRHIVSADLIEGNHPQYSIASNGDSEDTNA
jgi:predicted PurR-regulated permease PerM